MTTFQKITTSTLGFSLLGVLLSGYLTYWNLIGPSCHVGPLNWLVSCGGPGKVLIIGLPTCVYGFGMFMTVLLLSLIAIITKPKRGLAIVLMGLGTLGTLFSSVLIVYEIWILKLSFSGLPACVYGLILYLGILITSIFAYRSLPFYRADESRQ